MVERRDVLGHAQRVVGGRDEAARQHLHLLAELTQIHRHQTWIVRYLEPLDLQMVFGVPEGCITAGVGGAY